VASGSASVVLSARNDALAVRDYLNQQLGASLDKVLCEIGRVADRMPHHIGLVAVDKDPTPSMSRSSLDAAVADPAAVKIDAPASIPRRERPLENIVMVLAAIPSLRTDAQRSAPWAEIRF
jgi:hypothetical protein